MALRSALVSGISLSLGCGMGAVAVSTMRRDIVDLQVDLSTSVRETHSQINPTIVPVYNPTAGAAETPLDAVQRTVAEAWNKGVMSVHDTLSSKLR